MVNQITLKGAVYGGVENQYLLAQKYYYGIGAEKNLKIAEEWYKQAARGGHTASMFMYAYLLLTGESGSINLKKGTRYLKRACERNFAQAILLLARNYYYGYGVKRSEKKAFKLWKRGALLGSAESEYYLGLCYSKGIHVKQNIAKSKQHLFNALENGFDLAGQYVDNLETW